MSFNVRSFARTASFVVGSVAGSSNLNQAHFFGYATDDTAAVVEAPGYFNAARGLITVGTKISACMNIGAGAPVYKEYVVTAVPNTGNVTIAIQTSTAG